MRTKEKAILVVSFGTSYNENRAMTIGAVENLIAREYPEWDIRRAFTSRMIIKKLEKRDNEKIDYVTEAMERLVSDGIRTLVVQPTHVINGIEYDELVRIVNEYRDSFDHLSIGRPLLTSDEDYDNVVNAIRSAHLKDLEKGEDVRTAIVLMGHGTEHYSNASYSQLYLKLLLSGLPDVHVTSVEGFPSFEETVSLMKSRGYRSAVLFPFMLVAGDHANNDMAGEGGSLRSLLEKEGYKVRCVLKGLGEYKEFRELFLAHTEDAVKELGL